MKNSLLAIVLAAATMPLTFAAQANQPAKSDTAQAPAAKTETTKTKMTKKHKKHTKKGESKTTTATPSTPPQK